MPDVLVYDGFVSMLGGMNGSVSPSLVPEASAWNLVNVACRGGKPSNRPRFFSQRLTFAPVLAADGVTVIFTAAAVQAAFTNNRFQGMGYYAYQGTQWFWASIGGKFYRLTPQAVGFFVEDLTPDAGNDPSNDIAYTCQCGDYFVIQDGEAAAVIILGSHVYRARPGKHEMPTGTFMAYGYGRTCLCTGQNNYVFSDLIGEETAAPVKFKDDQYLAENSNFSLPSSYGNVTGIAFIATQDTATGQGPCIVFGENGAESVNISTPRTSWQTTQIQVEALTHIGACGHRSIVAVNGDLWFRSHDGWRSYRQARAEQSGANQVPQSTPVRPYTDLELPEELYFGSGINFNNRLLVTCNPQRTNAASAHSGMLSLDFDILTSSLSGTYDVPAWDGYWQTPAPVSQLIVGTFSGRKRAFAVTSGTAFSADGTSWVAVNGISEILEDGGSDVLGYDGNGNEIVAPITSTVETRGFTCQPTIGQNAGYTEKRLEFCDVYEIDRLGNTELKVFYREDGNLIYKPVADTTEAAPSPVAIGGAGGPLYTARSRSYVPADGCTGADTRLDRRFYDVQLKLVWTGELTIHRFRITGLVIPDSRLAGYNA